MSATNGNSSGRRVFLSYGHRDATELALRLRADLDAAGYSVWQDEQRIRAGHAWTDEIRQGLRESDAVVALLSPHSVRRTGSTGNPDDQDSVCLDEIEYAVDACKIPVLPVMAQSCEPPFRIFRLQYLDLRAWQESPAHYEQLKGKLLAAVADCLATGRVPLRQWGRLPEPWDFSAFLAERRRRFTGRDWLFLRLQERLANASGPVVLLTGPPGFGKSAVVATLVHENPEGEIVAYHCCQSTVPATLSPAVFVRSIAAMIAARDPAYAAMLEHAETADALQEAKVAADPASAFEQVVLNPLQKLPTPEAAPRVLLIDALDEALSWNGSPNLIELLSGRASAFPAWLKLVATTRDEPRVKRRFRTASELALDSAAAENDDDLRRYIALRAADPVVAAKVHERAAGNFLVAAQTLDALESGLLRREDLDKLAPGLHPLYEGFFDRLYKGAEFERPRKVLQSILAAPDPPSRQELAAVTGLDAEEELPPLLGRLASLIPARDGHYSAFHKTLADWLTGWDKDEDQPLAGDYYISVGKGHSWWADWLLPQYRGGPAAWDLRLRRRLLTHVLGARLWDDAARILLDLRFLEAKISGPGTTVFDLAADFELALSLLPETHEQRKLVFLVAEMLRLDAVFLAEFPQSAFQCLWNRGFWHDSPLAASFFTASPGSTGPWEQPGGKLSELVERWREQKAKDAPGHLWLRTLRPMPETLGTAQRAIIRADRDSFDSVDVSADGSRIVASISEGNFLGLWNAHSGSPLAHLNVTEDRSAQHVRFVHAGPHAGLAAAVTLDGRLLLLDDGLDCVAEVQVTTSHLSRVAIAPDGTLIIVADWQGCIWILSADSLAPVRHWQAHDSEVSALTLSPCARYVATGSGNIGSANSVRVWSLEAEKLAEQTSLDEAVESLCFSRDGKHLYWGDYGGVIERWEWGTGESQRLRNETDSPASVLALLGDDLLLCGVGGAFDPEPIEVWNLATAEVERRLHGHLFGVGDIAVFPDSTRFISAGDSTLRIWDLGMPSETRVEAVEPEVTWAALRPSEIITADEASNTAWVRSLADGALMRKLDQHPSPITAIALSCDAQMFACGLNDGAVYAYEAGSGRVLWSRKVHKGEVTAFAFTDNGDLLATAGSDGVVNIVRAGSGEPVHPSKHFRDEGVHNLAFSHSGSLIAVGTYSYLRVFEVASPKRLLTLKNVTHYHLWFAPEDDILIAEVPGQLGAAWHIGTKQPVPEGPELQALYGAAMLRAGRRWQWHSPGNLGYAQEYLKLVDTQTGSVVAAFPELQGGVQWHPSGRIWTNQRSRRMTVIALEG